MPQTEDIEYIKDYEAYDCINVSEDDDDFDPQDEPYEPSPEELQNMSQNPFTAKVFDPETMLFDLAEARKTETKFRESILSLMMSVLISSDKPNALLCGPAGCGKTKIVEELAYRLENSENIVPQLKGYKIYALQLSDIVADSGLMGDLENKVKMLINYMSDKDEKRILFIDEIHMLFQEKAYRIVAQILKPALSRGKIKLIGATTTQEANLIDSDPAFCRRMTKSRSIGFNSDSTSDTQLISDLSDYFDVELINRFSQKYTFSEISRSVYRKIVENRLVSEIKVIKRLRPELNIDTLFSADELAKAADKITADTYNVRSGARPAVTAVSKFIDSKLLSHFSRRTKTYRPNQN